MAVAEGRWQLAEDAIRSEINKQRETGVRTVETTTDAQGLMVVKETVEHRIDPQLLKQSAHPSLMSKSLADVAFKLPRRKGASELNSS